MIRRIFFLVQLFSLKNTNQDFVSDASAKCTNCSHVMAAPQAVYLRVGSIPTLHLKTFEQLFWPTI